MKRLLLALCFILLTALGCARKEEGRKLATGTPAYDLAKALSTTLTYLDPDQNAVLIETKEFEISAGDVCQTIQTNFGNRSQELTSLDIDRLQQFVQQTAETLAERKLLLAAASGSNIDVSPAEIDSVLSMQFMRAGGEERFRSMLEQNNVDFESVKNDIRTGITMDRYLNESLMSEIEVTKEEVRAAYEEDKTASVRHILLSTQGKGDSAKQEVRNEMADILARARAGEDFSELAKQYTDDPGSKNTGGLYQDFERGKMVKPFEDAAFSVPIGEISDIVETSYGYHILKVIDRKKESRPLEEIRGELEEKLRSSKKSAAYQDHIEELKTAADYKLVVLQ